MSVSDEPSIIYLPFGGGGAKFKNNRDSQISSWVKDVSFGSEVLHICGDESLAKSIVNDGILTLPLSEAFENGLERQLLALRWVIKNRKFDWICFSNTSNYFDHKLLQNYICENKPFKVAATIGIWEGQDGSWVFPSGAGTLVDYETCLLLSKFDASPFTALANDVALGKIISMLDIPIHPMRRVNITDWERYTEDFHYRVKHWHFSSITTLRMKLIWRIKKSSNFKRKFFIEVLNISQILLQRSSQVKRFFVKMANKMNRSEK